MSRRVAPLRKAPLLGYHVMASRAAVAPWTPASIAGLKLWIDFSDADTLFTDAGSAKVSSDGDAIYRAADKSGNNNHLNQITSASRPQYRTNVKNGLSVSRYDATDDRLMLTNSVNLLLGTTMFFISKTSSSTFPRGVFGADDVSNVQWRYADSSTLKFAQTGAPGMDFTISCTAANYSIITYRVQPSPQLLEGWVNGASTPGVTDTAWTATTCWITMCGDSYNKTTCLDGDICEWIIYDRCLSDADRTTVRDYLNDKWSIYEPAKAQSLEGLLSFEPEEEKLWWQGADVDVLAQAQPQVELTWWDKANRVVNEALAKAKKYINDKLYQLWQALEDYFTYDEEE